MDFEFLCISLLITSKQVYKMYKIKCCMRNIFQKLLSDFFALTDATHEEFNYYYFNYTKLFNNV